MYANNCFFFFLQQFVGDSFLVQDFLMGYQLVIAIGSTNLSGPYRDSLFFMPTYGVDDDLFPIAFSVINSKNYEDWL